MSFRAKKYDGAAGDDEDDKDTRTGTGASLLPRPTADRRPRSGRKYGVDLLLRLPPLVLDAPHARPALGHRSERSDPTAAANPAMAQDVTVEPAPEMPEPAATEPAPTTEEEEAAVPVVDITVLLPDGQAPVTLQVGLGMRSRG